MEMTLNHLIPRSPALVGALLVTVLVIGSMNAVKALQVPEQASRFDPLVLPDPTASVDVATTALSSLPVSDGARAGWERFRSVHGPKWSVHLDRRSGAPLLVEGEGLPWPLPEGATVESIAASLRTFIADNRKLLLADDAELVLDRDASDLLDDDVWQIVFDRKVAGVPVAGERYVFTIGHGNLISFGAPRWSRIDVDPRPQLSAKEAQERMTAYMRLTAADAVDPFEQPSLLLLPLRAANQRAGASGGRYAGAVGAGYASALVWRVPLRVSGEPGTWVALVDAHSGAIRAFFDDNKYARVKGGIYPISDDQICPDGCEQPNFPMPFADITIDASSQTATTMGSFNCSPAGSVATTTLSGRYVRISDTCGAISEPVTCSADLDTFTSGGIDCDVPAGSSAGNTHAARSGYYHLNRIAEHARTWLPTRTWLTQQLTSNMNLNQTCNAFWDGAAVNFFRSGNGCRNTGELAGVFLHEWGHGLDQNDGGGFDSPSEAYADITAFMATHVSCMGRGFRQSGNCGGYGDACLNCTGVRDQDWDQHASHTPATPAGFAATHCGGGSGPCGREEHCESYLAGETLWDLATRDLPAFGIDSESSWQLADKLWYKSRLGSGGNAYNCALPDSDGCSATSWFSKMRTADDDDGNLANGTPHAAAIYAAFNRHAIACGAVDDPGNQSSTVCPSLAAPILSGAPAPASAALSWTSIPNTLSYRVLRNDAGCQAAFTRVTLVSGTSVNDVGLANGFPIYYRVQALGSNSACDGFLSNCQVVTPQPFAGTVKLDAAVYSCASVITVTVTDPNLTGTPTVAVVSTTEPAAETIPLTRIAPASTTWRATITTTSNAAAPDGLLSVRNADTINATYVDASDGGGGTNIPRIAVAKAACAVAGVRPVPDGSFGTAMKGSRADATGSTVNLTWDVSTCGSTDHHILYGELADVAATAVTGASCDLGTTGSAAWTGVPAGSLWFVVVGDDDATTEGSWGTDGDGAERGGSAASGRCGSSARDNSGVCP